MEVKDEEGDEVVAELDVFLTKNLSDNIKLLQYPICKRKATFSSDARLVARVKPKHQKLELEVLLDVSSPNYDQSKGEQIAINVDGCAGTSSEGMAFDSSVMDTQVLSSSCIPQCGRRYAAATISAGQVHLTPISEVMQMRPSFRYMDRAEKRAIQAAQMKAQAESGNSSQDEAEDAKAVTVRFKGAETEAARVARERSYAAYEKNLHEEKWISATIHPKDDVHSKRERNLMFCTQEYTHGSNVDNEDFGQMMLSASDYLKSIVPNYISAETDSIVNPTNVLSLANLQTMSLPEQLRAVMCNVKIIHFSHLLRLLPGSPEPNSVVRSLQSYAVLVQGCWIVKSEILYPTKTLSPVSGTPCELVCKARDYILCLFSYDKYLVRRELIKKLKVPSEEVKSILEQIAVMKTGHGWHLRLEPDTHFMEQYPEVCERQSMVWSARYKQLDQQLQISGASSKKITEKHEPQKATKKKPTTHKPEKTASKHESGAQNDINLGENLDTKMTISQGPVFDDSSMCVDNSTGGFENMLQKLDDNEPMEVQFSTESVTVEYTDLNTHNPFVIPEAVGIGGAIKMINGADQQNQPNYTNLIEALPQTAAGFSPSINMESVNSTVQLVAKQMCQQNMPFDHVKIDTTSKDLLFHNNNGGDPH
uniref:DNA-directed RNA polymerase III subunit RPC5-like n=1 Tax=Phallusia mammillata TaxID=59560 RepID=A0A6F9DNN1_9ASCI|nr:DNA-directed RNA polymerase III subunit RPC5-like [Phallusia mammillata]